VKTNSTKLKEATDNYVRSVRILLTTVVCVPTLLLLGLYSPFILYLVIFVPLSFTVLYLIVDENAKINDIIEWGNWMDSKLASEEYLNALLYIQSKQFTYTIEPIEPEYFFANQDLKYTTYLKEKYH